MVVEQTERGAYRRFAVAPWIPRNRETRRPVVLVARESLLHSHRILRGEHVGGREIDSRQRIAQRQRRYLFGQLVVVTHAVVERQVATNLPRILREERQRLVADAANRIAEALNKVRRESESVLLHRREVGRTSEGRIERGGGESAEVEQAGEVQLEDRLWNANERGVAAELEVMVAGNKVYVVGELITRFRAQHWREELATHKRDARDIECHSVAEL